MTLVLLLGQQSEGRDPASLQRILRQRLMSVVWARHPMMLLCRAGRVMEGSTGLLLVVRVLLLRKLSINAGPSE